MTEFTFSTGAKSAAGVKVILTSGSGINAGKFISEEEAAALRAAVRKQKFDGKAGTFAEIFNGKTRIVAAGTAPGQTHSTCRSSAANSIRKSAAKKPPPFSFPPTKRTRFPPAKPRPA